MVLSIYYLTFRLKNISGQQARVARTIAKPEQQALLVLLGLVQWPISVFVRN